MIGRIRNSIITKVIWGIIGFSLLNICVDVTDTAPEHIAVDLSYNEQESIVELVVEMVLGYEDAISEHEEHNTEDHTKKSTIELDWMVYAIYSKGDKLLQEFEIQKLHPTYLTTYSNEFLEINSPPPKV